MVNKDTPWLEIIRTLWRLNPDIFLNGRTNIKDDILPPFYLYANATEVQDETFELANGTYMTKYDWANFVRFRDFYGVYGPDVVGSWWIHPSTEYFTGSQLSQTLTVSIDTGFGGVSRAEYANACPGPPRVVYRRLRPAECLPRHLPLPCWQ